MSSAITPARILIVDDDARNLRLLEAMLLPQGFRIAKALDGEEALEKVRQHAPDVILLDVMMPKMSGYEVCQAP